MSILDIPKIAVFDTETTGVNIEEDSIVSIAVIQIDNGEITKEWTSLVNPGREIPEEATNVHKITNEMVADAKPFKEVWEEMKELVRGRRLLGYNAATFDYPLVRNEMTRAGLTISENEAPIIDPLVWVREIDRFVRGKGRHSLGMTCKRWKIEVKDAHDALADCRMTWALTQKVLKHAMVPKEESSFFPKQKTLAEAQERNFQAYLARKKKEEEASA